MKTLFLMAAKSVVILLLTFGTRCGNCDIKSVGMIEDIPKTAIETTIPSQNDVDILNARNDVNGYNDAKTERNKDSISFQSNMKQFYHTDSKSQIFDSLTSKKKNIRFKRFVPSDDSNSTTTTTTAPNNLDIEYPNGLYNFDSIFETRENNDTFELLPTPVYGDYGGRVMINIEPIDTLEQAESLLFGDEAQRFLDEFTNEMQRDVVENHMLYCPYTPLCSFKYENIYLDRRNFKSPCVTCLCENCNTTGLCCPDKVDFNKPQRSSNTECKQMSLKDSGNAYEIVTKCSSSLNSMANDPCSSDQNSNTFSDILPVTDTTTNITYRNRKCATCNQVAKAKLVIWQPQLICVRTDVVPAMLKSEKDLIQFAKNSKYCDITYFMPEESVDPVICEEVVSVCNVTGNWSIYDTVFSTACSAYENIYTVDLKGYETKLYRYV